MSQVLFRFSIRTWMVVDLYLVVFLTGIHLVGQFSGRERVLALSAAAGMFLVLYLLSGVLITPGPSRDIPTSVFACLVFLSVAMLASLRF
jgi:hypothetical protein